MKLNLVTHFIFEINSAIDTGKYQDISIEEAKDHIEEENLLDYLEEKIGYPDIDLSHLKDRPDEIKELMEKLQDLTEINARKKMGIENSGLCFIIGLALIIIQNIYHETMNK